jgi:bacterioferritin (cytochrome b1)
MRNFPPKVTLSKDLGCFDSNLELELVCLDQNTITSKLYKNLWLAPLGHQFNECVGIKISGSDNWQQTVHHKTSAGDQQIL